MSAAGNMRIRFEYPEGTEGEAIPLARALVQTGRQFLYAQKQQQFINPGMRQFTRSVRMPDGSVIHARSAFGQDELIIDVTGSDIIPVTTPKCRYYYSGLFNNVSPVFPVQTKIVDGEEVDYTRELYPNNANSSKIEADSGYGPWQDVDEDLNEAITTAQVKTSGKYTGEMRKVVQALSGMNAPVPFSYEFTGTHGIWSNGDKPWVIEISAENGVIAAPMPTCKRAPEGDALVADLDYYPVSGLSLGDIFTEDNTTVLMTQAELAASFYNVARPYFSACGWAFNSTGTSAVNTGWDVKNSYRYGYCMVISIAGTFTPTGATINVIDEGYLWASTNVNHFRFPDEFFNSILSFDIHQGNITPPPEEIDTVWYAYYDGSTLEQFKYRGQDVTLDEDIDDDIPNLGRTNNNAMASWHDYDIRFYDGHHTVNTPEGPYRDGSASWTNDELWDGDWVIATKDGNGQATSLPISGSLGEMTEAALGHDTRAEAHTNSKIYKRNVHVATVPFHDREAVYIFNMHYEEVADGTLVWHESNGSFQGAPSGNRTWYAGTVGGGPPPTFPPAPPGGRYCYQRDSNPGPFVSSEASWFNFNNGGQHFFGDLPGNSTNPAIHYASVYSTGGPDPYTNLSQYTSDAHLYASGGVDEVLVSESGDSQPADVTQWTAFKVSAALSQIWFQMTRDAFRPTEFFASSRPNGTSGPDYVIVGLSSYPILELGSGINRFFIGIP